MKKSIGYLFAGVIIFLAACRFESGISLGIKTKKWIFQQISFLRLQSDFPYLK